MSDFEEIKWQPGYRIDWSPQGPVVRNAKGQIIATDLHVSPEDAAILEEKWLETLKHRARRSPR